LNRASTLTRVIGTAVLLSLLVPSAFAVPHQQIEISIQATTPVFAGQTVQIVATVQLDNGTAVGSKATFTYTKVFYPNGTAITLSAPTVVAGQLVRWTFTLPANAPDGLYAVTIYAALARTNSSWGLGSFTVNSQVASKSGLASITTSITSLSSQLGTLASSLATLSSEMKGNFSSVVSTVSTDYTALSGGVSNIRTSLGTLSTDMKANFTAAASSLSSDYGSLSTAVSNGFGGLKTSVGGLSTDIKGNFTALGGTLQSMTSTLGNLATSADISLLNNSISLRFQSVNVALGQLATSAQAIDLQNSMNSLANQLTLTSNIQDFLILPIVLFLLIVIVFVFFRKSKKT